MVIFIKMMMMKYTNYYDYKLVIVTIFLITHFRLKVSQALLIKQEVQRKSTRAKITLFFSVRYECVLN